MTHPSDPLAVADVSLLVRHPIDYWGRPTGAYVPVVSFLIELSDVKNAMTLRPGLFTAVARPRLPLRHGPRRGARVRPAVRPGAARGGGAARAGAVVVGTPAAVASPRRRARRRGRAAAVVGRRPGDAGRALRRAARTLPAWLDALIPVPETDGAPDGRPASARDPADGDGPGAGSAPGPSCRTGVRRRAYALGCGVHRR